MPSWECKSEEWATVTVTLLNSLAWSPVNILRKFQPSISLPQMSSSANKGSLECLARFLRRTVCSPLWSPPSSFIFSHAFTLAMILFFTFNPSPHPNSGCSSGCLWHLSPLQRYHGPCYPRLCWQEPIKEPGKCQRVVKTVAQQYLPNSSLWYRFCPGLTSSQICMRGHMTPISVSHTGLLGPAPSDTNCSSSLATSP